MRNLKAKTKIGLQKLHFTLKLSHKCNDIGRVCVRARVYISYLEV